MAMGSASMAGAGMMLEGVVVDWGALMQRM
jgi:hypothetical protein